MVFKIFKSLDSRQHEHTSQCDCPVWLTSERGAVNSWFPFINGIYLSTTSRWSTRGGCHGFDIQTWMQNRWSKRGKTLIRRRTAGTIVKTLILKWPHKKRRFHNVYQSHQTPNKFCVVVRLSLGHALTSGVTVVQWSFAMISHPESSNYR
jgi:hypothetical protein